jgi:hypothetical protein
MSLHEMPTDIINSICDAIIKKEEDENVLIKFKDMTIAFIKEKEITVTENISYNNEENEKKIDDFIFNYIRNLTKKQMNSIICDYGISKGLKLFHNYHKIGLDDPDIEICEILNTEDYGIEKEIVELIIKNEIGYHTNWRTDGDGRLNTIIEYENAITAYMTSRDIL